MANATITGTASNFGSISGVLAGEAGTVAGTITGTVSGTLTGSVGVPGAGVPSGGTTGQVLKKVSNTDYDTTWGTDIAATWGSITGTLTDQTDLTAYVAAQLAGGTAVAKNLEVYVRNQSGATLTAGTIVYIDGATGNRPTVTKAQANNDANSAQTFGFIKENIANNGFGYVIVRGELENVDTSALTEGQQLYLSPTTAGTWTTTKPSAPQHLVYVGICIRAHPTQGIILVAIQNGYELDELHDVKITSVSNGQVLKYDSAQGLWVNGTDSSGVAWGGITGTLSAQTDLQTALDGKLSLTGGTVSDGSTVIFPSTAAGGTLTAGGSDLLKVVSSASASDFAQLTYSSLLLNDASGNQLYVLPTQINFPDSTVQSTAFIPADYLSKAGNLSGLADTSAARSNLGLGTMATATASDYSTTTVANGLYYPLSSNPAGYLTSAPVTSVAGKTGAVTLTNSDISGLGTMATATATDYLAKAGNLSGLADLATSRSNLGLGTMATETASNYLTTSAASSTYLTQANAASTYQTQAGMSSYLTTSAAASTYQTQAGMSSYLTTSAASSTYAPLASPALTGTPTAPTAAVDTNTTQVATTAYVIGQGYLKSATASSTYAPLASPALTGTPTAPTASAGTSTTQIATTAFVQQEVPDFAATSDIASPSSTTKVVSPNDVVKMITNRAFFDTKAHSGSFSTSGAGAEAYKATNDRLIAVGTPSAGVAGYGQHMFDTTAGSWGILGAKRGSNHYTQDFSKKIWASGTCMFYAIGDSATTARVMIGGRAGYGTGNPTKPSIGWKLVGGGSNALVLVTYGYNGSIQTVTEATSTFTPVLNQSFDWALYHEPNISTPSLSKVYLYVNDNLVATVQNAPADTTVNYNYFLEGCESTGSHATRMAFWSFPTMIWWSRS